MNKNKVADLGSISKIKIDQPSAETKKKEEIKKKQKQGLISQEMAIEQLRHKNSSSENEGLAPGSPAKKLQNQQSQDTLNQTNPPSQPPKQKKKMKGILVQEEMTKRNVKTQSPLNTDHQGEERKDHFGVVISKGANKNHRIYFNPQIQEVYEVENWKEYNIEEKYGLCSCKCNTFQMTLLTILAM
ncbi:hypothetical protein ABPG72_017345 [Tetrahymena utriculariae]